MSKWCLITGQIVGSISSDFRNWLLFGRSRPCGRFQGPANWVIVSFKWICHIWFKPQNEILFSNCGFIISIQVVSKMRSFMVFHTFIFNDYCQLQNFKKLLDGKIDSVEIVRDSTLKPKILNFRNNQKIWKCWRSWVKVAGLKIKTGRSVNEDVSEKMIDIARQFQPKI